MVTEVSAIRYNSEFRPTQNSPYLAACIGEKIDVEIDFYWEDIVIATEDIDLICAPTYAQVGSFYNLQELVYSPDVAAFANYQVGDTFEIQGSAAGNNGSPFLVTEVVSPNLIRVAGATFVNEILPFGAGALIFRNNELRSTNYSYNLIPSGFTFTSLIDGEQQKLRGIANTAVYTAMVFNGIKSYQIGSAQVQLIAFTAGRFLYRLKQELWITPFFLAAQWNDLLAGIRPSYFNAANCLKHVFQIGLNRDFTNPVGEQILNYNEPCNTGWFGENFNGGPTNYYISQYSLTRVTGAVPLTALEFDNEIEIKIRVKNTINNPFNAISTKVVLNFCYLPEDESLYQNNGRDMKINFVFDRVLIPVNTGNVNGDNFATNMQVIKNCNAVYVSNSEISLTGRIIIGPLAKSIMTEGDFSRYMFWVTTENPTLTSSDRVALLVDRNEVYVELVEDDLIQNQTLFIKHPYTDKVDGEPATEVFPVDDLAARSDFFIDFTGRETDNIKINSINSRVSLSNGVDPDIILDDFVLNTAAYPIIAGLFQNINFQQSRVFNIPANEIRKVIDLQNNFPADAGLVHNWYLNFPFMVRWEYYLQLIGLTSAPTGIFDPAFPFNGLNNFWHRLSTVAGWNLKYSVKFSYEQKGASTSKTFTNIITSHDYNSNPEWINESIKSYDINSPFAELTFGGNKFIKGYEQTTIKANFEWASGPVPAFSDIVMVIWIERYESSGVQEIRRISSLYVLDSGSWFLSSNGSGLVVITQVGNVFTGTCVVNNLLLPAASKYRIYARLYHLPTASIGNKIFQNADFFDFQDGSPYDFQS